MKIILSPAKKMIVDTDNITYRSLPRFIEQTERVLSVLQKKSYNELKSIWKCSDKIASENVERLRYMDLHDRLTPAIFAYDGLVFKHIAPSAFTEAQLEYLNEHLLILSGFYGVLRPFDGVTPYRLEMQAKLAIGDCKDLYEFWSDSLAKSIFEDTDTIINLASKEYSKCIYDYLPSGYKLVTCVFAAKKGEKLVEQGTACKMARGEMVRFMTEHNVKSADGIKQFNWNGYAFSEEYSKDNTYVFIKEGK